MSSATTPRQQPSALKTLLCIVAVVAMCIAPFFLPSRPKADHLATVVSKKIETTTTLVPIGANGEMAGVSNDTHYVTVQLQDGRTYTGTVTAATYRSVNKDDQVVMTAEMKSDTVMKVVCIRPLHKAK